jgi:glycerol-3-phosphate dehydrogenase (NAD(P)+)
MPRVAIIGNTTWGNTLAALLGEESAKVTLWARSDAEADELNRGRHSYTSTSRMAQALANVDLTIWAVPSQTLRDNVSQARDYLTSSMLLMSAAKGLEVSSGKRMSEVLAEEVPPPLRGQICVLSGPNLAREIAQGLPAASVIAAHTMSVAESAQQFMRSSRLPISVSDDVIGVELGGALKNTIALGAGMIDGLELGDNAKGAFIAWGWTEVISLGTALGARASTFYGLAGLGDLIATCSSALSRNYHVGYELAKGCSLSEIAASMPHVAEGVATTLAVHRLAEGRGLKMPVINLVYAILHEGLPLSRASIRFGELAASHG